MKKSLQIILFPEIRKSSRTKRDKVEAVPITCILNSLPHQKNKDNSAGKTLFSFTIKEETFSIVEQQ